MLPSRLGLGCLVTAVAWLSSATALAHIDLLQPEPRAHGTAARGDTEIDVNSNLKSGPCGQITDGRGARVSTYAPGERLTVRVREENAHVSYLRVSIDLDGEDFPRRTQVPAAPETQEQALAAEMALGAEGLLAVVRENNDTPGFVHEIEVTLPNATCDNCTLQVIQFMYDDPAAPYYFQCADLVIADRADAAAPPLGSGEGTLGMGPIAAPPASDDATGSAERGSGGPPTSPLPVTGPAAAMPDNRAASAMPGSAPLAPPEMTASDDGGCSLLQRAARRNAGGAWPLLALALAAHVERRRRAALGA